MFFKMAAIPTNFHHISAYSWHTVVILMAIPRFLGSMNPFVIIIYILNVIEHEWRPFFLKMAAIPTNFHHISAYIVDTQLWFWWLYLGFGGQGIHWNHYIKCNRARVAAILYFKMTHFISPHTVHRVMVLLAAIYTYFDHISAHRGHWSVFVVAIPRF